LDSTIYNLAVFQKDVNTFGQKKFCKAI
jgi:hypothetical protein